MASINGYKCKDCEHIFERATGPLMSGAHFVYCRDCGQPNGSNPTFDWAGASLNDLIEEQENHPDGDESRAVRRQLLEISGKHSARTCRCGGKFSCKPTPCCPECGGDVQSHLTVGSLMMLD